MVNSPLHARGGSASGTHQREADLESIKKMKLLATAWNRTLNHWLSSLQPNRYRLTLTV
jgi:hypothetical protein